MSGEVREGARCLEGGGGEGGREGSVCYLEQLAGGERRGRSRRWPLGSGGLAAAGKVCFGFWWRSGVAACPLVRLG